MQSMNSLVLNMEFTLSGIPELDSLIRMLHPGDAIDFDKVLIDYIQVMGSGYVDVIRELVYLTSEDLEIIKVANSKCKELGLSSNSAVDIGADHFIETLGQENLNKLLKSLIINLTLESEIFQDSIKDLWVRMKRGHELAEQSVAVGDGLSNYVDYAIWGHTKNPMPLAMIHFVMCHFFERMFSAIFSNDENEDVKYLASHKDSLLSAMSDLIKLRKAQEEINPEIYKMWFTRREDGGLSWGNEEKQVIYNQIINNNSTSVI